MPTVTKPFGSELPSPGLMSFSSVLPFALPLEIQSSRPRLFWLSSSLGMLVLPSGEESVLRDAAVEGIPSGIRMGRDVDKD